MKTWCRYTTQGWHASTFKNVYILNLITNLYVSPWLVCVCVCLMFEIEHPIGWTGGTCSFLVLTFNALYTTVRPLLWRRNTHLVIGKNTKCKRRRVKLTQQYSFYNICSRIIIVFFKRTFVQFSSNLFVNSLYFMLLAYCKWYRNLHKS